MHIYPKRVCLEGLEIEIFKLVSYGATHEQWKEWLRVPLEHAAARGNLDLFNKLLEVGADGSAGWRGLGKRRCIWSDSSGNPAGYEGSVMCNDEVSSVHGNRARSRGCRQTFGRCRSGREL